MDGGMAWSMAERDGFRQILLQLLSINNWATNSHEKGLSSLSYHPFLSLLSPLPPSVPVFFLPLPSSLLSLFPLSLLSSPNRHNRFATIRSPTTLTSLPLFVISQFYFSVGDINLLIENGFMLFTGKWHAYVFLNSFVDLSRNADWFNVVVGRVYWGYHNSPWFLQRVQV